MFAIVSIVWIPSCADPEKSAPSSVFSDAQVAKLVLAAEKGEIKLIDRLVQEGVDVNTKASDNVTPLLRAFLARNKKGYASLLQHGADPNIQNSLGLAVLSRATWEADSYWLDEALKHKGNPNLVHTGSKSRNETPLFFAINENRLENAKLLIAAGADLKHKDGLGYSPLMLAAGRPAYDIAYELLMAGADYRQEDSGGDNYIGWVSRRNEHFVQGQDQQIWFLKTVDFLKEKGEKFELLKK